LHPASVLAAMAAANMIKIGLVEKSVGRIFEILSVDILSIVSKVP
jgi:hypothetical protein